MSMETADIAHGTALAVLAVQTATISVLRSKGLLTEDDLRQGLDRALLAAERLSATMSPDAAQTARDLIEGAYRRFAGPTNPEPR